MGERSEQTELMNRRTRAFGGSDLLQSQLPRSNSLVHRCCGGRRLLSSHSLSAMPAASLSPPSSGALTVASLPSLHASFTSEHAILEQLLYKNKNQHRKANYYQKLMAVARSNRHINLTQPTLSSLHTLHTTADNLRSSLTALLLAAEPLYALLRQTYFMPLALTSLAVLARLLVVIKAALLVVLVEAKEREEREADRVRLFAARSVGTALLRAVRERRVEDVVAGMAGYELDEPWTGGVLVAAQELPHAVRATGEAVEEEGQPLTSSSQRSITMDDAIIYRNENGDSALQPTTLTGASLSSRQPPLSASTSVSKRRASSIRTPATPPMDASPPVKPQVTIPGKRPISATHPDSVRHSPAPATAQIASMGSRKRKEAPSAEQPTAAVPLAQQPMQGKAQRPMEAQRVTGSVRAAKAAPMSQGKPNAPLDDIDAIFGF